jgi:hypothetical protein
MIWFFTLTALGIFSLGIAMLGWAGVVYEGEDVFLVDRTGEQWKITQAVSIGFHPRGFQFGIGRDAIRPLDASSLCGDQSAVSEGALPVVWGNARNLPAIQPTAFFRGSASRKSCPTIFPQTKFCL